MTDLTPDSSPALPTHQTHSKPVNKMTPWVVTLCLHGMIFAGAYVLYQRAVQSNQFLTVSRPTALSTTANTAQKDIRLTLDSTTPIAINQEAYAPSPAVRRDLPVLTTADIIAAGDAIRAAQNGTTLDSAVSATANTPAITMVSTTSSTSKTTDKATAMIMDASDEALTNRDLSAKDRQNSAKNSLPEVLADDSNPKTKLTSKPNATTKNSQSSIRKTEQAHQNSHEADQLSKSLEETNDALSKTIDAVKNKNRQKIAKEFDTKSKPTAQAPKDDDTLRTGIDEPSNGHKK